MFNLWHNLFMGNASGAGVLLPPALDSLLWWGSGQDTGNEVLDKATVLTSNAKLVANPCLEFTGVEVVNLATITASDDVQPYIPEELFGPELNPSLDYTDFTIEATWTITDGVASGNGANGSTEDLKRDTLNAGDTFCVSFEISNYVSGSVSIGLANNFSGQFSGDGSYYFCGVSGGSLLNFRPTNFNGDLTFCSVKKVNASIAIPTAGAGVITYTAGESYGRIINGELAYTDSETSGVNLYPQPSTGWPIATLSTDTVRSTSDDAPAWGWQYGEGVNNPDLSLATVRYPADLSTTGKDVLGNDLAIVPATTPNTVSPVVSEMVHTDPQMLQNAFWSADGITLDRKTYNDFIAHLQWENNQLIQWNKLGANDYCHGVEVAVYEDAFSPDPDEYTAGITWTEKYTSDCGAGKLVPIIVDSGGIGPSGTWLSGDDGEVILGEEV